MGLFRHHNQMPPRIKRKLKQRLLPVAAMEIPQPQLWLRMS